MKKTLYSNTVKIVLSATISIIIATRLDLEFSVTAGIISILSIQGTRVESILVAIKRFIAVSIAILLSYFLYLLLGTNPIVFGLFLLIFVPITKRFSLQEGMVVGAVLSTHLLVSNPIDIYWIINEFGLTLIGIGVALIFNLFTESLEHKFEENKENIEDGYRKILYSMGEALITHAVPIDEQRVLYEIEETIASTKALALEINNNYLFKEKKQFIKYIDMRIMQMDTIKRMKKHFQRFYMKYEQTKMLSNLTKEVANNLAEENDCLQLINKVNYLRDIYKQMDLPKSRDEFENRALLFQFLNDLEEFLQIKREYYLSIHR
ncbi:aromatic acid exporter family protein [Clostridium sp.]|uniref:aromatic acid exporter family protein n=1 Tax=Clostridium sp. TaxID=1506 RepID=UPI00290F7BB4|nr:aromatic acid exporter family protein [Clostridium sp.]MDU4144613.1 aromatic acid exporter family protein [Clostridium sp.]